MTRQYRGIPARHSLMIALICFVLALICFGFIFAGCSPTAPTETLRLTFSPAPNCSPEMPLPPKPSDVSPTGLVHIPGTNDLTAAWLVEGKKLQITFRHVGDQWLVCGWSKT